MNTHFLALLLFLSLNAAAASKTSFRHQVLPLHKKSYAPILSDQDVKIFWLENDTFHINESYLKTITQQQRAALGYITTFVGNDCDWDGDKKTDESNLKCKLLAALDLGYQCSEKHLSFLREWFKGDQKILEDLQTCKRTPASANIQDSFIELRMLTVDNTITITYSAVGFDFNAKHTWKWTEESIFTFTKNEIKRTGRKNIEGGFN
ncbi:MAG: hypothetical protein ABIP27_02560 [Flavobacterium circumlabens]|uniref:Uncharacterized protein n=1 Tax=Flavobacterium circumlabens TaxID=2133765 RepID=A0A4Y7UD07_9FLAO|nr:hypothetical protein [Flavobacterium circumlabens]TCN57396.1 hypothetical protein EV142_10452 [Flavobacterium circumlabens]TEB43719.1 hypothetical protein D0809_12530 [Flavobacterium circumlabens]